MKTFTIVTTAPNALCEPIRNRVPTIVDAPDWQTWLGVVPMTSEGRDERRTKHRGTPYSL